MAKRERIRWKNQMVNLVAIAIGVYLAFWVNQWQQRTAHDQQKVRYLAALHADLQSDYTQIQNDIAALQKWNRYNARLLAYSKNERAIRDSLSLYITGLSSVTVFHPKKHTYQALLAHTAVLTLLDLDVNRQLSALYAGTYIELRELDDLTLAHLREQVVPRILSGNPFPRAYLRSASFRAVVQLTFDLNEQKISAYTRAADQVQKLMTATQPGRP
jgi:hypothetical protein